MDVEYLTDNNGKPRAVVMPIDLWRRLLPREDATSAELSEAIEDYCLNKAMDEAHNDPVLNRDAALRFLKTE